MSLHEEMLRGRHNHAYKVPFPVPLGPDMIATWDTTKDHLFERAALEGPLQYLAGGVTLKLPSYWEPAFRHKLPQLF